MHRIETIFSRITQNSILSILLIFLLSILIVPIFNRVIPESLRPSIPRDYINFYAPVAQNLLDGNGLLNSVGNPAVRYPPGYPLILAGWVILAGWLGISTQAAVYNLSIICFSLTCVIIYWISKQIWSPGLAMIPALLWLTYPFALWLAQQPSIEMPFLVFLLSGFGLWWEATTRPQTNKTYYFIGGIFIGLSMLVRPIALFVGVILGGLIFVGRSKESIRSRLVLLFIFLGGILIPVLPWEIWAYYQTGEVILLSTNGPTSIMDGLTFAVNSTEFRETFHIPGKIEIVMTDLNVQRFRLDSFPAILKAVWVEIQHQPVGLVQLIILKALRGWYATDSGRGEIQTLIIQVPYLFLLILSFFFCWKAKTTRFLALTVGLLILYFWGMTTLVLSILRYMSLVFAFGFLLAPGLYLFLWDKVVKTRQ